MAKSLFYSLALLSATTFASPLIEAGVNIRSNTFLDLALWAQYAAAAYCDHNYEADANKKVRCEDDACPRVERAQTQVVVSFTNTPITDTSGYVALDHSNRNIILAVRGSESMRNFQTDINIPLIANDMCEDCQTATGYWDAWQEIRDIVYKKLKATADRYPTYRVVSTGHSMGGTVASFAATELRDSGRIVDIVTFGMPRIGNDKMASYITAQSPSRGQNYRLVKSGDSIPALPPQFLGYRHYGPEFVIHSADGEYPKLQDIERVEMDADGDGADNAALNWDISGSIKAHESYFGKMSKCYDAQLWTGGGYIPPNRMVIAGSTNATVVARNL